MQPTRSRDSIQLLPPPLLLLLLPLISILLTTELCKIFLPLDAGDDDDDDDNEKKVKKKTVQVKVCRVDLVLVSSLFLPQRDGGLRVWAHVRRIRRE